MGETLAVPSDPSFLCSAECLHSPSGQHEWQGNFRLHRGGAVEGSAICRWCRLPYDPYMEDR